MTIHTPPQTDGDCVSLYRDGYSVSVIAERLSLSRHVVMRALERTGVKRRSAGGRMQYPMAARFWAGVKRNDAGECWPWQRSTHESGHGNFGIENRVVGTHRVAFFLTHGYWPNICRHTCDNPPCCNPAHLLDGTRADNVRDASERGQVPSGERHYSTTLTAEDVINIRTLVGVCRGSELAREFGVAPQTICNIQKRRSWRHI